MSSKNLCTTKNKNRIQKNTLHDGFSFLAAYFTTICVGNNIMKPTYHMWVYFQLLQKKNMATFIAVSSWRVVQSYTICGAVYDRTPSCTTDWIEEEESFYVFTFIITLRIIITIIMRGCRFLYSQQKRGSSYNI